MTNDEELKLLERLVGEWADANARQQLRMHYFDSRGVFRIYDSGIDQTAWRWWRDTPGFSQRFTGTFSNANNVIIGQGELRRDNVHWEKDLAITYRRRG